MKREFFKKAERTRVRFKFWKTTHGLIQPEQTTTFKYDVTNYITIADAQFIIEPEEIPSKLIEALEQFL